MSPRLNPKKGERWKSKDGDRIAEIRSHGSGVVTYKIVGELGITTKGLLRFLEEFRKS
jgi:hypothetical protein